jgi:hypothetical protein
MKCNRSRGSLAPPTLALLGLTLLLPGAARAQTTYKIQPIVKLGDKVGDLQIKPGGDFEIGTLNDNGQIVFVTENAAAGAGEILLLYANGQFTPLFAAGKDAPGGIWSKPGNIRSPVSMNQLGNVVFAADITVGNMAAPGTFLWDAKAQKVTPIAMKGMPAVDSRVFETGGAPEPAINNSGDIAFPAAVKNAAGTAQTAVFFLGRDGKLLPVALPDQELPGGGKVVRANRPTINEAGRVAFLAQVEGDSRLSAYLWQAGTITPLAVIGTDAPGGGKFVAVTGVWVNNKDRSVLVGARIADPNGPDGLYRFAEGKLIPMAVPGQEMPGGGKLTQIAPPALSIETGTSFPNDLGQFAFQAILEDGATAAYLLDPDGTLSLILKSGMTTNLGTITRIGGTLTDQGPQGGFVVGLNSKGQVALTVRIDGGIDTMVLLTPTAQ